MDAPSQEFLLDDIGNYRQRQKIFFHVLTVFQPVLANFGALISKMLLAFFL